MQHKTSKKFLVLAFASLVAGCAANYLVQGLYAPSPTNPGSLKPLNQTLSRTSETNPNPAAGSAVPPQQPQAAGTAIRTTQPDAVISYAQSHSLAISNVNRLAGGVAVITIQQELNGSAIKDLDKSVPGTVSQRNVIYHALSVPNDPLYPQWYTDKISAPGAWDITTGSPTVEIAVLDTGFALSHEDLVNRWAINSGEYGGGKQSNGIDDDGNGYVDDWRGWDFVNNDNDPSTTAINHGTETAGLAGAQSNNAKGVASINWLSPILPLQVLDDTGSGTTATVISALAYARAMGVKVASLSFGSSSSDPLLKSEIDTDISSGMTIVASAGNCGSSDYSVFNNCGSVGAIVYPANYPEVVAVGATDSNDNRASFSSYGPNLDVMAPGSGTIQAPTISGSNVTTAYSTSLYGTSFATPIVAGLAALIEAEFPSFTESQVVSTITQYADKVTGMGGQNRTDYYGYGRINARASLADPRSYTWSIVGQYAYTDQTKTTPADLTNLTVGQKVYIGFQVKNTGNVTWTNSGANPIHAGASSPRDRNSAFCDLSDSPSWLSCNRPANMTEASVAPGGTATFDFWYKAASPGIYLEYFEPVAEGITWMNYTGLNFYTVVHFDTSGTGTTLGSNQSLTTGQSITSSNGNYKLIMQGDGNLVLYSINRALWSSRTDGTPVVKAIMQSDGNLVLYDAQNKPYWASNTVGKGTSSLIMQADGNLVIYNAANQPTWATYTNGQL